MDDLPLPWPSPTCMHMHGHTCLHKHVCQCEQGKEVGMETGSLLYPLGTAGCFKEVKEKSHSHHKGYQKEIQDCEQIIARRHSTEV